MDNGQIGGIRNPKPLSQNLACVIIYVGDMTLHAKIQTNRPSGASRQMVIEISLWRGFYFIIFLWPLIFLASRD